MNHPTLTVEVHRRPAVESRHAVHAILMNGQGDIVESYGDPARATFPRSCLKPLQAIALVESGAADHYGVSERELALACASHNGEEKHTSAVAEWLQRIGFDDKVLECGPQVPYGGAPGASASVLCNNCSGKHTGMVTLSLYMKESPVGYTQSAHPVQRRIMQAVSEMCNAHIGPETCGIDGCSAPNPLLSMRDMARGFAAFMNPHHLAEPRRLACQRLFRAMVNYPFMVGGTNRLDTVLMESAKGKVLSKTGAEGVYLCLSPEKDAVLFIKAEDGNARAAQAALCTLMEKYALADDAVLAAIRPHALPVLKNWNGTDVGFVQGRLPQ